MIDIKSFEFPNKEETFNLDLKIREVMECILAVTNLMFELEDNDKNGNRISYLCGLIRKLSRLR